MDKNKLLLRYFPKIAKVSEELYRECRERSKGICEVWECDNGINTLHHICGRRRMVWQGNLIFLCGEHHQGSQGIHGFGEGSELNLKILQKLQAKYFEIGFTEDEVRYLMGSKSNKLY